MRPETSKRNLVAAIVTFCDVRRLFRPRHSDERILRLERLFDYRFKDIALARQALTHTSYVSSSIESNERLEFLGDSVISVLVTEHLYKMYIDIDEGQLSKIKSLIVSRKILGEVAKEIDLGAALFAGHSETDAQGVGRMSILSNAYEAVVGAVYLDGGIDPVRKFLQRTLLSQIDYFLRDEENVNYKSRILEMSQQDGFGIPQYRLIQTDGPEHARKFTVQLEVAGVALGTGCGNSKKLAQQQAAREALKTYSIETIQSHLKGEKVDELLSD